MTDKVLVLGLYDNGDEKNLQNVQTSLFALKNGQTNDKLIEQIKLYAIELINKRSHH